MFNILVAGHGTAWETDQLMRMLASRFKECSGIEAAGISLANQGTLQQLQKVPSLLMYECGVKGPNADVVRYGYMSNITVDATHVVFRFSEEGIFSRSVIEEFADRLGLTRLQQGHTHWAIKDGGIPSAMLAKLQYSYDVVFSFAGEDRPYVEQVAAILREHGVKVFYDEYEQISLWGKDLAEHLDLIYRLSARYCVLFISEHYVRKNWTIHERRSAVARAMLERTEYILPARFDATEVPGILPTVMYISLSHKTPADFAEMLVKKVGRT